MGSTMNVNLTEIVTLQKTDSVVHFKNKITNTIDFLLKSYATPDNSAVQFTISINVSEFKGTSNFNTETNTNKRIEREINSETNLKKLINNETNEDDPEDEIMVRDMIKASQQRISLKSTAVGIINEKVLRRVQEETKMLENCQKSFAEDNKKIRKLSRRQRIREKKRAILMECQKEMENQAQKGIKRKYGSNEQNEPNEQIICTEQKNRLIESDTTQKSELNVSEGNQLLENSFTEPKRSDMWKLQMVKQRHFINKTEPEASGGNHQEQFIIENNTLTEPPRIPQLENYAPDFW